ncbi:MAG: hypothetical protein RLN62_04635 [Rickettsiales bacterium]
MQITKFDLKSAASNKIINTNQAEKLWKYLESKDSSEERSGSLQVMYYLAGLLILGSLVWFLFEFRKNSAAMMGLLASYVVLFVIAGKLLWRVKGAKMQAGLFIMTAVVAITFFAREYVKLLGDWPASNIFQIASAKLFVKEVWLYIVVATSASLLALRFYKFSLITLPLSVIIWYLALDISSYYIFGITPNINVQYMLNHKIEYIRQFSLIFGFLMLITSYVVDLKYKEVDLAFWPYLVGTLIFWFSISFDKSYNEIHKFIYFVVNIFILLLSIYLRRRIVALFGAVGIFWYCMHLASHLFKGGYMFAFSLVFLGSVTIVIGVIYQKNSHKIEPMLKDLLPKFLLNWRPQERT